MAPRVKNPFTTSSANTIRRFGEHLTWIQEPDIFGMRLSGTISGEELTKILDWQMEWAGDRRSYFVLCDVTTLGTVSREARQVLNQRVESPRSGVTSIIYGASFGLRVIAEMVMRARKALGVPAMGAGMFVANQAEAKALLEKLREAR